MATPANRDAVDAASSASSASFELPACAGRALRCTCTPTRGQAGFTTLALAVAVPPPVSPRMVGAAAASIVTSLNDVVCVFQLTPALAVTVVRLCTAARESDAAACRYGWRTGSSPHAPVVRGAWHAGRRLLTLPAVDLPPPSPLPRAAVVAARCHPHAPIDADRVADLVDVTWHGLDFHLFPLVLLSDVVLHLAAAIPYRPLALPGMGFTPDEAGVLHRVMYSSGSGAPPAALTVDDALVLWRIYDIFDCSAARTALEAHLIGDLLVDCDARIVVPLLAAHDRGGRLLDVYASASTSSAASAASRGRGPRPSMRADWALARAEMRET
jgi:hypothetical protein